jgi:hypothetical protein
LDEKERELRDLMREERSRGRKRRVDIEAERVIRRREEAIRDIASAPGRENELRELLRAWGKTDEEIEKAVTAYLALYGL